ncbi:MAG: hypothetical protein AW10_01921 [Candidatus Accumulibacter appositus]|uniref:Uncharacterized protein n=2 Tax=Candidatus Accumulibacter TaxID=327159 RepID=A0A011PTW6_9PROT|nr:hypothetical protein [Accumulibacter sp.]EXI80275.1 MAG: hypothetical protein AW10_01921 [Candidatus Accumulibacter appositus]HRF05946.1 hypothetical protein [Accumulibacter sp.]
MARKRDDEWTNVESLIALLSHGYTDEVRAFTKSIQANPSAVTGFERLFK